MQFGEDLKSAKLDIESGMIDTMLVERFESSGLDPHGRPLPAEWHTIYENVICFISPSNQNNDNPNNQTEGNIPVLWRPLILSKLENTIKAGDKITVTRPYAEDAVYKGKASDVNFLPTHIEFNLGIDKEA